jgi:hypothetical protein
VPPLQTPATQAEAARASSTRRREDKSSQETFLKLFFLPT